MRPVHGLTVRAGAAPEAPPSPLWSGCKPAGLPPLPAVDDEEGARVPAGLPPIANAHVHLFPDRVFEALWRWFAWPVRYKLRSPAVLEYLLSRGVERVVALHYAHKPGLARAMNAYLAGICRRDPRVLGVATVFPGKAGAAAILDEAFALGLRGVTLHCHVQSFSPDEERCAEIYDVCERRGQPIVVHAGREPRSPAYPRDPYELCSVDRTERVLRGWPRLRLCVPHLGADEFEGYARLLERHENLWLDTTMMRAGYFPGFDEWSFAPSDLVRARPDRIIYGTDFPKHPVRLGPRAAKARGARARAGRARARARKERARAVRALI